MCFEILGLDIIITQEGKPQLLEVNHTPSFSTGSQLDFDVKSKLIHDALKLMNISEHMRRKIQTKEKRQTEQRVLTGKRPRVHPNERDSSIRRKQQERDDHIRANLGNFEEVYPSRVPFHSEDIEKYLKAAHEEYQLATSGTVTLKKPLAQPAEAQATLGVSPQATMRAISPMPQLSASEIATKTVPARANTEESQECSSAQAGMTKIHQDSSNTHSAALILEVESCISAYSSDEHK